MKLIRNFTTNQLEQALVLVEESLIDTPGEILFGALEFGALEGDALVGIAAIEDSDLGGIMTLIVDPNFQGQGIGDKLLQALIKEGKKKGWEFIESTPVHPATKALMRKYKFENYAGDVGRYWFNSDE